MGRKRAYRSMESRFWMSRREVLRMSGALAGAGLVLGTPDLWAQQTQTQTAPVRPKTNIEDALKAPRRRLSLPGLYPGKVVQVRDAKAMKDDVPDPKVVKAMFRSGLEKLTGKSCKDSFDLFFAKDDVVGIKVNPAGGLVQSSRPEVVLAIVDWLTENGIPKKNIIVWDRFGYSLKDAGLTEESLPGVVLEGLQTMDEEAAEGKTQDNSRWLTPEGKHISLPNFDQDVYYWADVEGPTDMPYLNQHVVNGKYSYFGKLVTQRLTKIINVPVFKNTGNGISIATKNLGYGAICNTGRLHKPIFFDVCTEVLAFPCLRDKVVLNVTDGLRGQYDGGPMPAPQFTYTYNTLFLATDPFASDMHCHKLLVQKRKEMKVKVNEHPMFTEYLRYAERLGLGVVDAARMQVVRV
jgi:hypothetical protein